MKDGFIGINLSFFNMKEKDNRVWIYHPWGGEYAPVGGGKSLNWPNWLRVVVSLAVIFGVMTFIVLIILIGFYLRGK